MKIITEEDINILRAALEISRYYLEDHQGDPSVQYTSDLAKYDKALVILDGIEDTFEYDGQPDEAQEWHDFDPDC